MVGKSTVLKATSKLWLVAVGNYVHVTQFLLFYLFKKNHIIFCFPPLTCVALDYKMAFPHSVLYFQLDRKEAVEAKTFFCLVFIASYERARTYERLSVNMANG